LLKTPPCPSIPNKSQLRIFKLKALQILPH
jgi:hypothetical protein